MPRIKDLKDKRLYKMSRDADYGCLEPLFHGVAADVDLIPEQWDQLVRMVASLRNRTSPAHLVVQRLATGSPPDRLSRALTALGQICKTIHILRYVQDEALRQWIQILLNRGEFRHALAKVIFFANQGIFRSGDYEEIMNKASCLSLLCNAILVWNTVHMAVQVDRMRSAGLSIPDERLARVSPLAHSHVIPNGTYFFDRPIQGVNIAHNMLF
jgi:TnpA family transposase